MACEQMLRAHIMCRGGIRNAAARIAWASAILTDTAQAPYAYARQQIPQRPQRSVGVFLLLKTHARRLGGNGVGKALGHEMANKLVTCAPGGYGPALQQLLGAL